jgi:glycosyltransferase involved in cell wall biosynthesis
METANRKKICFLLSKEFSPHQGVVRPFINWGKKLVENGREVHFVLLKCKKELEEFVGTMDGILCQKVSDYLEIVHYLTRVKPSIVLTDDKFERLRLSSQIKSKTRIRTCVYIQTLFGIHAIAEVFDLKSSPPTEKALYRVMQLLPFDLIKRVYVSMLKKPEILISNSKTTATLLQILYGIESNAIVYPPVNVDVFKPYKIKENHVLLYLGSHTDVKIEFAKKIMTNLEDQKLRAFVLGNNKIAEYLNEKFGPKIVSKVSDNELAEIYSKSKLVICPQKWEPFGYVSAEAVCCGTPALVFSCVGSAEIIENNVTGFLANNEEEFLRILSNFQENLQTLDFSNVLNYPFNIAKSTEQLSKALET